MIRSHGSGEESDSADNYYLGLKVEARYCARPKWSFGVISKVHLDGTFDIDYMDGDLSRTEKVRRYCGNLRFPKHLNGWLLSAQKVHRDVVRYPVPLNVGSSVERRRWDKGPWKSAKVHSHSLGYTCISSGAS